MSLTATFAALSIAAFDDDAFRATFERQYTSACRATALQSFLSSGAADPTVTQEDINVSPSVKGSA